MSGAMHRRVGILIDCIDVTSVCHYELHGFKDLGLCSGLFLS